MERYVVRSRMNPTGSIIGEIRFSLFEAQIKQLVFGFKAAGTVLGVLFGFMLGDKNYALLFLGKGSFQEIAI